jgi:hypothetical protein
MLLQLVLDHVLVGLHPAHPKRLHDLVGAIFPRVRAALAAMAAAQPPAGLLLAVVVLGPVQAAPVCQLCRTRVAAEMHQHRGTRLVDHLKLVLSIIDRQVR